MMKRLIIILLVLFSMISLVSAQDGIINYGDTRMDTLDASAPQKLYAFNGNADEIVTIYVLGWSDAFQPSVTVLGPTGQLAFSSSDALSPMQNDARVTVRIPQTGGYSILVGSANGVLDSYTIALRLMRTGISTQLGAEPVTLNMTPGGQSQAFSIQGSPDTTTPISIASTTPDFAISGYIATPDGHILTAFDGALPSLNIALPPNAEPYLMVIMASDPTQTGTVSVSRGNAVPVTDGGSQPPPIVTEEVTSEGAPPSDQCAVTAGPGGVNIRSGPSTDYPPIGGLAENAFLVVRGQNNGWYNADTIYGSGWIAGSVVTLSGPCNNLPFVDAPPLPPTAVPTATYTHTPTTENTNITATPSATPTSTHTPTATATENANIAPIDSDHNLTVDRDAGGQFTNTVSYPDGDTSDRVRITVDGLSNNPPNDHRNLTISLACVGEGAANVSWGSGGPSAPTNIACGGTLQAFHTNDSNQTFLNINMSGAGFVTYTVIVTTSE